MKYPRPSILLLGLAILAPGFARAQLVADGATATLNNITTNITGTVTIGTNAPFTQLILTNGAFLTNSGHGVIGRNAGANSNTVRLTSLNTRWLMSSDLIVGSNGAFNRLIVTNGAHAENNFGVLGFGPTSSNNEAIVTSAGSLWSNRNDVYVGYVGRGNRLVISNGGLVVNHSGLLGADAASADNQALVTGAGSVWSNRASIFVGFGGHGNRLVVSNQASVVSTNLVLGVAPEATNSRVIVDGGTLRATAGRTGVMDIRRGTNQFNAGLIETDFLLMTNAPGAFEFNGGLLITHGASISNNAGFIVGRSGVIPAVWDVRNGPSIDDHLVHGSVIVGSSSPFNQLLVTNGASLFTTGNGDIGLTGAAKSNMVFLSGAFTRWTLQTDFHLGLTSGGNRLVITNGAELQNEISVIGSNAAATNNEAVLTGPGSLWTSLVSLFVGAGGAGNRLVVTNGAVAASDFTVFVGSTPTSTNNRVIVDGGTLRATNSSNSGLFDIRRGTNQFNAGLIETDFLLMTNALGAFEFNGGLHISHGARISNSAPFIVGRSGAVPAVWDVRNGPSNLVYGSVVVGSNSSFNQLLVTNGASLFTSDIGRIGVTSAARSNLVFLSGASTRWTLQGDVTIGVTGAVNRLVVTNGAGLSNESGVVGSTAAASNNEAVVTGSGSFWTMLEMVVGGGPGNRVVVTNGGVVTCRSQVVIGNLASSTNNRVIVDGGGTLRVTNTMRNGLLLVRGGTNVLNAGLVEVDRLLVTNGLGQFELDGGTLITATTTNNNGRTFFVGNGTNSATLQLAGGTHVFSSGLVVRAAGTLAGNGTITGAVTIQAGGHISPGESIGKLVLNNSLSLQGGSETIMEVSKSGSTATNDQIRLSGGVTYGGFLRVTNIGPTALTAGDRFQLFPAAAYSGAFAGLTLPPLTTGLTWANKLSFDGSIEVLAGPYIASTLLSGTNLIVTGTSGPTNRTYFVLASPNVALPLTNWTRLLTNQFSSTGNFTFTNPIAGAIPHRFYTLQVP